MDNNTSSARRRRGRPPREDPREDDVFPRPPTPPSTAALPSSSLPGPPRGPSARASHCSSPFRRRHGSKARSEGDDSSDNPPDDEQPATYALLLSFGLPGFAPQRQAVHLYFEPAWRPRPPVSVFLGRGAWPRGPSAVVTLEPAHPSAPIIAVPFDPIDINADHDPFFSQDHHHADHNPFFSQDPHHVDPSRLPLLLPPPTPPPLPPSHAPWWWNRPYLQGVFTATACIACCLVAWQYVVRPAMDAWAAGQGTADDWTLEYNGTVIAVADDIFNTTLSLEQPLDVAELDLPGHESNQWHMRSASRAIGDLCSFQQDQIRDRPDLNQSCFHFQQAALDFDALYRDHLYRAERHGVILLLSDLHSAISQLLHHAKDTGYDEHDDPDDDPNDDLDPGPEGSTGMARFRRRSRDAGMASWLGRVLAEWRHESLASLQQSVSEQERILSIMVAKADDISVVVGYEMNRRGFKTRYPWQLERGRRGAAKANKYRIVIKRLWERFAIAGTALEGVDGRVGQLLQNLRLVEEAAEQDKQRLQRMRRVLQLGVALQNMGFRSIHVRILRWFPPAPVLEDAFFAGIRLEDAMDKYKRQMAAAEEGA
ncbi:hypothetical protein QBC39DRAFT_22357 [Podospora conica]|nr:hypothetical protein QBC39DRAFT_22357 [Schizothecium conicum]